MELISGKNYFKNAGLLVPEILLPAEGVDLKKWACIACDQYTSSPDYWRDLYAGIGNAPSAAKLILPEICIDSKISLAGEKLSTPLSDRIDKVNATMRDYLENGTLSKIFTGLVYVERTLSNGAVRKGFLAALDLEQYDYAKGSESMIRASEETVPERIPPRLRIRENALLELPHAIVLIDDLANGITRFMSKNIDRSNALYDIDLENGAGNVKGFGITDENIISSVAAMLEDLKKDGALYSIGDGNHSFAAAKAHWERLKRSGAPVNHPARFMLTEIESIHDRGICLEPIHRVIFDCEFDVLTNLITQYFGDSSAFLEEMPYDEEMIDIDEALEDNVPGMEYSILVIASAGRVGKLYLDNRFYPFPVAAITDFIDFMLPDHKIDYVHGTAEAVRLVNGGFDTAICLPKPSANSIFKIVAEGNVLPRKTFSIGDADMKRYYVEARKIR